MRSLAWTCCHSSHAPSLEHRASPGSSFENGLLFTCSSRATSFAFQSPVEPTARLARPGDKGHEKQVAPPAKPPHQTSPPASKTCPRPPCYDACRGQPATATWKLARPTAPQALPGYRRPQCARPVFCAPSLEHTTPSLFQQKDSRNPRHLFQFRKQRHLVCLPLTIYISIHTHLTEAATHFP